MMNEHPVLFQNLKFRLMFINDKTHEVLVTRTIPVAIIPPITAMFPVTGESSRQGRTGLSPPRPVAVGDPGNAIMHQAERIYQPRNFLFRDGQPEPETGHFPVIVQGECASECMR
jgi:hypothetical protein